MIKINVENNGNGKKIVTYLQKKFNKLSSGSIYKALRNKDIRVNNIKISENITLNENDIITLYIKDEVLFGNNIANVIDDKSILYDDKNVVIVNKPKNILVQSNNTESSLETLLSNYYGHQVFACHRLDRNTTGLIIFAKNKESQNILLDMIKNREISKYYKCLVYGSFEKNNDTLIAYLFKDSKNSNVIISDEKKKGYTEIITKYNVIQKNKNNTTLLEIELVTGKTHQIRAHLAHIGHPIIGDGKYGINKINKQLGIKTQELQSYKLVFNNAHGILKYLKGKIIEI